MAASITLGTAALSADGKTITAPISGGSAPYSITNASGITVNVGYRKYPVFSVAVVGANLAIVLLLRVDAADAVTLDISTDSSLTDSASNTPTGQTAIAVTNGSEYERTEKPVAGKILNLSGIAEGIIAAYSFSEGAGGVADDSLSQSPMVMGDYWGTYRGVTGIKQDIALGQKLNVRTSDLKTTPFAWAGQGELSISIDAVITANAANEPSIIGTGGDTINWLTMAHNGVLTATMVHAGSSSTSVSGGSLAIGEPFSAVITMAAGGFIRLYINGALIGSAAMPGIAAYGRFGLFNMNNFFSSSDDPSGYVGAVYVWDRELHAEEVAQVSEDPYAIYAAAASAATAYTVTIKSRVYAGDRAAITITPTSGALEVGGTITVTSSSGEAFILTIEEEDAIVASMQFVEAGNHVLTFTNSSGMTNASPVSVTVHPGYETTWTPPALLPWGNLLSEPGTGYITTIENGSRRSRNAFLVGETISFRIPQVANFGFDVFYSITDYEVRDFSGTVIASGAFTLSEVGMNTLTIPGITQPGWYRLYLIDSAQESETYGSFVGGFNFTVWPTGSPLENPGMYYLDAGDLPVGAAPASDTEEGTLNPYITASSAPLLVRVRGTFSPTASGTLTFARGFQQRIRVTVDGIVILDGLNRYASLPNGEVEVVLGESYEVEIDRIVPFGSALSNIDLSPDGYDSLMSAWTSPTSVLGKVQVQQYELVFSDGEFQDDYLRALLGCAAGPQRFTIKHDTTVASITGSLMAWRNHILGKDPARPRKFILAFPDQGTGGDTRTAASAAQFVEDVMALGFTTDQFGVECTNEPDLSYGSAADWVPNVLTSFYAAMKAVNPDIEVIAPCPVAIHHPAASFIGQFLAAGGAAYCDSFSIHFYNCGQGDFALTRKTLRDLKAVFAAHAVGSRRIYQTEQGDFTAMYGIYAVRHGIRWTMSRLLVMEQEGIPAEQNYYWYDYSHFWDFPMYLVSYAGMTPVAHAFRIYGSEVFGKPFTSSFDFGALENIYLGSLYTGAAGSVAVFVSNGDAEGEVTLAVTGAESLEVISWDGRVTEYEVDEGGQIIIPVPDIPTYVRLPIGASVAPVIPMLGSNLALVATVSDSRDSGNLTLLNNGAFEHNRYEEVMGVQWFCLADMRTEDAWVQLEWGAPQTFNRVHIYCPAMFSHDSTLLNYALQYWDGAAWVDLEEVVEGIPLFRAYMRESSSKIDDFSRRRNIFQHRFPEISTSKIRVHAYITTWGGNLTEASNDAGGQGWVPLLALREIEVFNEDISTMPAAHWRESVLALNPSAFWRLGEAPGTAGSGSVFDAGVGGYHGTPSGATFGGDGSIAGDADRSVSLGSEGYIEATGVPDLTAHWTITMRIKTLGGGTGNALYSRFQSTSTGRQLFLYLVNGVLTMDVPYVAAITSGGSGLNDDAWHSVAATRSGDVWTLYADGSQVAQVIAAVTQESNGTVRIGRIQAESEANIFAFTGSMDEVAVFDYALTGEQILALHVTAITEPAEDAPTITSASTKTGQVGEALSYTITATGTAPITFGASGLPAGLTVNTSTGAITGTPTTAGDTVSSITATNAFGSVESPLTFTVSPALATGYTLTGPASGRVGSARTFTIAAVGGVFVGTEVFTPVNTDLTGSFSAATVTPEAGSSSVLFQFTGSAESSGTIGVTDDQGWTDPAAIAFTVAAQSSSSGGGFRLRLGLGLGLTGGRGGAPAEAKMMSFDDGTLLAFDDGTYLAF